MNEEMLSEEVDVPLSKALSWGCVQRHLRLRCVQLCEYAAVANERTQQTRRGKKKKIENFGEINGLASLGQKVRIMYEGT